ncbi:N-acylneuraminate cytidylyltransferase [Rhizorhapis suberifaciens]|uniref:N-acylneuraminate cytidylyltransferase n=1 Tax=Rhizorhapis suberifaciens TaxID=13656 RepID=A0A840HPV1_9SPHN|nr:N-acylneuraminate cytidylyltransferase [Rhizorhapis suberifaciens]
MKPFFGKPIIERSIEAALSCDKIDRVIVSTDDAEIAEVAQNAGVEVPFVRAAHLSDDHATIMDVIADTLEWADREINEPLAAICCLYATAPFVRAEDLSGAYRRLKESGASCVFTATEYAYPIQRALRIVDGRVAMFQPNHLVTRSQDLEPAYHDAGQFYWLRPDAVRARIPIFGPQSAIYLLDRARVQDIDTIEDWNFAERLFALAQGERGGGERGGFHD